LTGKSVAANAVLTNAGAPNWNLIKSCVWKGAIYSATAGQQIAKRASLFAGPPTVLGFAALGFPTVALIPSQQGNFLMQAAGDSTPNVAVRIISNDTTASAVATGPAALTYFLHTLWEGAGGVLIALAGANSAIFRSTNVGASWTPIDAPNLGSRLWVAIWQSGANTYMLSQLGALATSTDAGATWGVVNTALPGAAAISTFQTTTIATSNNLPSVVLDQAGRRGYALMVGGAVTSWSLDTPTSGFITEVPANHFTVPATPTSAVYMFGTPLGLFVFNLAGGSRNGLWFAKFPATPGGMAPFTFATQQAGLPMYQAPSPPSGMDYIGGWGLTLGDGFIGFDNSSQSPGAVPASFGIADGITRFDRYAVTDPLLASGRKPFMRVL
jgi:hypothetical protein